MADRVWRNARLATMTGNGLGLVEPAPESDLVGVVDPATGEIIGAEK